MSFLAPARRAPKDVSSSSSKRSGDEEFPGESSVGASMSTGQKSSPPPSNTPPSTGRNRGFFRLLASGNTGVDNNLSSNGGAAGSSNKKDAKKVRVGGLAGPVQPPFRRLLGTAASASAPARAEPPLSSRSGLDGLNAFANTSSAVRRGSQVIGEHDFIAEDIDHIRELRNEGSTASELHHLGISAGTMKRAGFTARELRSASYTRKQLSEAGFSSEAIQLAGFQPIAWSYDGIRYCSQVEESIADEGNVDEDRNSGDQEWKSGDQDRNSRSGPRRSITDTDLEEPTGPSFEEWARLILQSHSPEKRYAASSVTGRSQQNDEGARESARDQLPRTDLQANQWGAADKSLAPSAAYDA